MMTDFETPPKIDALEQLIESAPLRTCPKCGLTVPGSASHCPQDGFALSEPLSSDPEFSDKYEIQELIGKGGMSVVYKARQKLLNKIVAIKMLHPHLTADDRNAMRFQREGKAISKLDHPHIVKIHDFGFAASGQPYMVMDFLEGDSLSHLIAENGYLTVHTSLDIFEQICSALAHAHEQGILHRDLKPSNIVVLQNKFGTSVKLVDFGIAKITEREGEESKQVTQTGEIFGSPYYMSPEQCKGNRLDERSDIYSLGCILFECLTGRPPHQASSAFETMIKHINEKAPLPSEARPDLQFPARVDALLSKLLAVDTKQRYRSVNAVLADLEIVKKDAAMPQSMQATGNKRKRLIMSLGAVTLVVAASLLTASLVPIFSIRKQAPKPPPPPVRSSLPAPTKPQPAEPNTDTGVPADVLKMLDTHTEIDLHKRKRLNDSWIKEIARHKNITLLNLSDTAITDSGVAQLAGMLRLDTLKLSSTGITSKSMATVAALPALTVFAARNTHIDDDGAKLLGTAKHLQHLLLPNAHLTGKGLKYLGKMRSLQELDVWKNHVGDSGVAYLQNPNLDNLSVGTTGITDRAAAQLSKLTTLRTLYLSDNEIGDSGLAKIAKLSHLSLLWLRHTPKITDAGIKHLEHLAITDLDLWGDHVTDECINSILTMDRLERLVLRETYITDKALDSLQKAKRLKSLSIYQTNITDAGLRYVGQMKSLEHLNICRTPIADVGLTYLKNLTKLTSLDLAGCPNISAAAIDAFKKARPTCKVDVKTL